MGKQGEIMNYTYDYSKTMMMKLCLANPDRKGGSIVNANFEKALSIIKQVDNITLGVQKIIYLVGWQYCGHDDKYPAFFEVNPYLKRQADKTALDSLLWLMEEAKKFNTIVSLHINFTDAYEDSPIFWEYKKANALIRNAKGEPAAIEKYNGRACYKISYKEEWENGLFHKRVDKLFEMLPIEKAGTVHVDNFQCYVNRKPFVSAEEQQYYRRKMIAYLRDKGVDITSEFTYREGKQTILAYGKITRDVTPFKYPIACLGEIPAVWWTDKMTLEEYFKYYPKVYGGGMPKNSKAANLFYGNIHGEDLILQGGDWQNEFIRHFISINVPYFYLNSKQRVGFCDKKNHKLIFSDGTISTDSGEIYDKNGNLLKSAKLKVTEKGKLTLGNSKVFLPYCGGYVAYCDDGGNVSYSVKNGEYVMSEITAEGLVEKDTIVVTNNAIQLSLDAEKGYFLKLKD